MMLRQLATTKMSSRGQIVIAEEIREQLGLETGTKFVVLLLRMIPSCLKR
ncbi:AbrB/MazE/SpoVT family DNA-binding domain-containing protein [Coxiella-like endosymbiont of Rhipicephalus sanguineus]|nr:AbrB/MazE/SpoVT family DNA-binding domain-containing protein [Coxiella-like endosymbiont of Rhipicephalus sanguineus]